MVDKFTRALELAAIIKSAEEELAQIVGEAPRRRGRPRKENGQEQQEQLAMCE